MKLSDFTLTVLKNFASINSGVVLQKGNTQKTMSPEKSILVEVELEDTIPEKFGIYDLNQFLGNITTMSSPDLTFAEKYVTMKDDVFTLHYLSCNTELIVSPPDKELVLNDPDVTFDLSVGTFQKLIRLAAMNSLPHLSVVGKDGNLSLQSHDKSNPSSNFASAKLSEYSDKDFSATFKADNLKIIPDDYTVAVKGGAFAKFTSKTKKLTYFIALENTKGN